MVRYVVDASVAIKWFFQSADDEGVLGSAIALLRISQDGEAIFCQPPHFVAEVAAVLARKKPPDQARADVNDLLDLDLRWMESAVIYLTACDLAVRLNHHLFDTLYHAVALHAPETTLVTADRRYFDKARSIGRVVLLGELDPLRPR